MRQARLGGSEPFSRNLLGGTVLGREAGILPPGVGTAAAWLPGSACPGHSPGPRGHCGGRGPASGARGPEPARQPASPLSPAWGRGRLAPPHGPAPSSVAPAASACWDGDGSGGQRVGPGPSALRASCPQDPAALSRCGLGLPPYPRPDPGSRVPAPNPARGRRRISRQGRCSGPTGKRVSSPRGGRQTSSAGGLRSPRGGAPHPTGRRARHLGGVGQPSPRASQGEGSSQDPRGRSLNCPPPKPAVNAAAPGRARLYSPRVPP